MAKKPKLEPEPDQLTQAYSELGAWSSPLDFQRKVDALNAQVKNCEYFSSGRFKSLREAWILAEFARLINADSVRLGLVENSLADGYVRISGDCREVQITEADRPGRKRGDEYKAGSDCKGRTCEPINDAEDVAKALCRAIENKTKYPSRPTLVVLQNLGVHGRPGQEVKLQSMIVAMKGKYASHFADIYILHNGKLLRVG
jgi:hypothetical protein